MKTLILNLPRYKGSSATREGRCELLENHRVDTPATLLIIASILRENNYDFDFIDANGLNLSYKYISNRLKEQKYDIVIFTFISSIFDYELKICEIIKEINSSCITIGYSWWARNFGKEILEEYQKLDILIIEDPFSIIEDLMSRLNKNRDLNDIGGIVFRDKNNKLQINPTLNSRKDFNELPLPAYDLLETFRPYYIYSPLLKPYALVYAGRGCPFGCRYCNVARTKYSGRSAENIIKELKLLKNIGKVKYVWFFDEIFTINKKRVIEICKRMIKEKVKIKWLCDSRADLVDKQLLQLMRRAGCIGISYGIESGSQIILNNMNKNITVDQAKKALKWTREAHIPIQLNLILGYIGENEKTLRETQLFVRETLPEFIQANPLLALVDTEFIDLAIKNGWLSKNVDWKTNLISPYKKLNNYKPYELKLWKEISKINKILHSNIQWWIVIIKTLIWNPKLILPIIGIFLKKSQSIKIRL
ncbi:MAG: B12-binding domain-containing radical SAM protein [Promethearchaeota archaeon]